MVNPAASPSGVHVRRGARIIVREQDGQCKKNKANACFERFHVLLLSGCERILNILLLWKVRIKLPVTGPVAGCHGGNPHTMRNLTNINPFSRVICMFPIFVRAVVRNSSGAVFEKFKKSIDEC